MGARKMPQAGYYVFKPPANMPALQEVIMVTGTTKGNKYLRPEFLDKGWADLLWTCVPSQKDLAKDYDYFPTEPVGWWTDQLTVFAAAAAGSNVTNKTPVIPPPNPPAKKTDSDEIKKLLAQSTGIAASHWNRWCKYKVGSAADKPAPNKVTSGFDFATSHPQYIGKIVRVFGAPNVVCAVFDAADGNYDVVDLRTHPNVKATII